MILAENNKSDYRIVIAAGAGEALAYAARELAKYLGMISGASLPIAEDEKRRLFAENRGRAPVHSGRKRPG